MRLRERSNVIKNSDNLITTCCEGVCLGVARNLFYGDAKKDNCVKNQEYL
jgi:hypothetical protein